MKTINRLTSNLKKAPLIVLLLITAALSVNAKPNYTYGNIKNIRSCPGKWPGNVL
jgi:hypothetical protein